MRNKLATLLMVSGIFMVNAATTASGETSQKTSVKNTGLTVPLLDSYWANREDTKYQKIIADYLMTLPKVPNDFEAAWKTSRLVYFIGNYGLGEKRFVDTSEGVTLFDYGAKAGLLATTLNPKAVDGYYWYAIDLGSYGLAKGILSAAANAKDGMKALESAKAIDPSYQWYGSDRILGRYYQELPGMFGGDADKALALINSSTQNAPTFRNNWVFLGQYYISAGQYDKALEACNKAISSPSLDGKYEEIRYLKEAKQCVLKSKAKIN